MNLVETPAVSRQASTRDRIMAHVMEHGSATSPELAAALNLTQAAVRRHLTELEADGLVAPRTRKARGARTPGRPSKVYEPTPKGRDRFEHDYDALAIEVLSFLRQAAGDHAVEEFARQKFADLEEAYSALRAEEPELSGVEALRLLLCEGGYMADLAPLESGDQLRQHHCPYSAVAERFPELCEAETQAFSRLLGSHVQRLATIAHGDGVCTTHIPFPRRPDRPADPTTVGRVLPKEEM
ncbi:MAG: winged helix-turn-helix transcriptional regulator [Propionibacteriaceae bacterium]|nr:winged helix-turn-helix transcriptional regulator [Propionibacteriaceae bacterium]